MLCRSLSRSVSCWNRFILTPSSLIYFRTDSKRYTCSDRIRVRFAPSPTGELHLGGLRTALFNYLFAKGNKGDFLIRIEDTDQTRVVENCEKRIVEDCKWIGIHADEPITYQSKKLDTYKTWAEQLVDSGHAYRCFCSSERLADFRKTAAASGKSTMYDRKCLHLEEKKINDLLDANTPHTIRLKVPRNESLTVQDLVYKTIKFDCKSLDDQILLKTDGFPTYHLASVVDDHHQQISHVIRGEEWIPSLPKHLLLYRFLQWPAPRFAHLPLLLNPDKSKLSKRQDSSSLQWYRDEGYEKEAILAYIAALGWTPPKSKEDESLYLSLQELLSRFSLDGVSKSGAVVDLKKLNFINSQYLNHLATTDINRLTQQFLPLMNEYLHFDILSKFPLEYVESVIALTTSRMKILKEFTRVSYFFREPIYDTEEAKKMKEKVWKAHSGNCIALFVSKMEHISRGEYTIEKINAVLKEICEEETQKMGTLYPSFRYALTASFVGAGIPETMKVLGFDATMQRLQNHE